MEPISDKPETGKDEFEERIELNRASPIYQGLQLLKTLVAQAGFKDHWNYVATNFLFSCNGDMDDPYYKEGRALARRVIRHMEGIKITNKQHDECCSKILEKIDSGELNFLNGTN